MLSVAIATLLATTSFLAAIPAEPGAVVLAEGAIYQAVAVDLDAGGGREVVILAAGDGDGSVTVSAWGETDDGWVPVAAPITGIEPAAPATPEVTGPVRLLVRRVDGADRLTLLRQPPPEVACCVALHDIVLAGDEMRLVPVAPTAASVGAAWVIDLDGDETDELVLSRSVTFISDRSYPVDASLYRWTGSGFTVTTTRLPSGSGDTPFRLGDTDGRPGDELGIIATLGRPQLHRVSLRPDGSLGLEDAGLVAQAATAVPVEDGAAGIAILNDAGDLAVHAWPFGAPLGEPVAERFIGDGALLGVVEMDGTSRLVVHQPSIADRLHVLGLPDLAPPLFGALTRSPAASAFGSGPVTPYVGPLPGGDAAGRSAIIYAGRLLSGIEAADATVPVPERAIAAMAGAGPVGLVGRGSIALFHAGGGPALPDPAGGRLDPPRAGPDGTVSVAPLSTTLEPELDGGMLEPPVRDAVALDDRGTIGVGGEGFAVTLAAPPGSRVHVGGPDPSLPAAVFGVPASGSLVLSMPPPPVATPSPRYRAVVAVVTPAGHSYLGSWDVRVLTAAPPLDATVRTPLGSERVEVRGLSGAYVRVRVDGSEVPVDADGRFSTSVAVPPWPTDIAITAVDPLGNEARAVVTAIGWVDYRQLPWVPIAVLLVGAAAVVLALRVPRTRPILRRADDDAVVEELEPD